MDLDLNLNLKSHINNIDIYENVIITVKTLSRLTEILIWCMLFIDNIILVDKYTKE